MLENKQEKTYVVIELGDYTTTATQRMWVGVVTFLLLRLQQLSSILLFYRPA